MQKKDKLKRSEPGKRVVMVRVTEGVFRQLRVLAASKGKENAEVVSEAISLLAAKLKEESAS